MLKLLHEKNNALQAIYELTLELSRQLEVMQEIEEIEYASSLIDQRNLKIDEVKQLDRRITLLEQSGQLPKDEQSRKRIEMERGTMQAIVSNIQRVEKDNQSRAGRSLERLMDSIHNVKDGIKSVRAYGNPYDGLDTPSVYIDTKR